MLPASTTTTQIDGYLYSDDKSRLDHAVIYTYLHDHSYWAKGIPLDTVLLSIQHAVCFGIYTADTGAQVGFARLITDHATFGYLADVFVLPEHRGQGLSKNLMRFILSFPQWQQFRRLMLGTRDAHGLYAQFGFQPLDRPENIMQVRFVLQYDNP